tara:strand:- start:86 stop:904 length:819 start_codon:yes stop_codon:yes gene_type:complete
MGKLTSSGEGYNYPRCPRNMAAPKMTRGSFRGLAGTTEKDGRTRVMLIMPRSHRPEYEQIVESVQNNEPVFSTYLRPRTDLDEIKENGFDASEHSLHLIDIATKDLGIWMKPLVSSGWKRTELETSPTSNADFSEISWMCFRHTAASESPSILLPFDPLDVQGKCYTHPSQSGNDEMLSVTEIIDEIAEDSPVEEVIAEEEDDDDEDSVVEIIAEENTESPLKVEVRQTIEMLRADGLDMTGIMEHPKFLDVSERASVAGIDVWTMVVGMFQ